MALVPYSTAVNVGAAYTDEARGAIPSSKAVTSAAWWDVEKDISGATRARPVVITQNAHGLNNDDLIYITGIRGMTQLNNKAYVVKNKTVNTFELYSTNGSRIDGRNYSAYQATTADKMKRCIIASGCDIVITAPAHGFATNDYVRLTDVSSNMSSLNGDDYQITKLTSDTFSIPVAGYTYVQTVTTGKAWCTEYGCQYYRMSSSRTYLATPACVTERSNDSFSDTAPSTTPLAIHYTSNGTCGSAAKIQPLTSDKTKLNAYTVANALTASGATAGQLGTAWAWYLVSPEFAELFDDPAATVGGDFVSKPAEYAAPNTLKIVIIMTDGEYNTEYCKGVSPSYSGCSAPDGITGTMAGPFGQAEDLCYNMKQKKIVVYTVGFNLGTTGNAVDLLRNCATDPDKAKLANDSAGLVAAFREIGENISNLRLSM